MTGNIYLIRNLVNGKGYVGKTILPIIERFAEHKQNAKKGMDYALARALRKHGFGNFSISKVVTSDVLLLDDLERHYIQFFGTFAPSGHGYNLTKGGEGSLGWIPSEKTRIAISISKIGKKQSAEHIAKRIAKTKGKKRSAEVCEAIRIRRTGQKYPRKKAQ